MRLELIGLNHRTASIEVREQASMSAEQIDGALRGLSGAPNLEGVAILSTCNRTEIYLSPEKHFESDELRKLYCRLTGLPQDAVEAAYVLRDDEATRHLLRVAAGLDIEIRWGGDWDGDNEFTDQSFDDLVHFETREGARYELERR